MKPDLFLKSALGAVLLTIIFWLSSLIWSTGGEPVFNLWGIAANFLIALVLGYLIINSNYQGLKLAIIVFIVYFLIGHFNLLVEALIFNVTDRGETITEIVRGFVVSVVFSPIYVYLFKKKEKAEM